MNIRKSVILVSIVAVTALASYALPPSKQTSPIPAASLRSTAAFEQVQPGDKIALVCKECNTVSVQQIESKEEAMKLCVEGATMACPSCKTVGTVVRHGPPGKEISHTEFRMVNAKGEECMFYAKLPK